MASVEAISWRSKEQTVVALSTCETEYVLIFTAFREDIWLKELEKKFGPGHGRPNVHK